MKTLNAFLSSEEHSASFHAEARRFGEVVAFQDGQGGYTAFHASNLEVADIPKESWDLMTGISLKEAKVPQNLLGSQEASTNAQDLHIWNKSINPEVTTQVIPRDIRTLTINTTQICNLACAYCAAGGDGTYQDPIKNISIEKTLPQLKFFIEKLPSHGYFQIILLGGEPLLYPQALTAIGNYAKELCQEKEINFSLKIITNATLVTPAILDSLKTLRPSWTVSLDGKPEINDQVRPSKNGKSSTAMALAGLQMILGTREYWSSVTVHAVFNKANPDVESAYNFFKSLDVDQLEFTLDVFEGDEAMTATFIQGMNKVAALAYSEGGEAALRKILTFDQYFEALDQQARRENHCGSGKSLLSIDARNQVFTCPLEVSHKDTVVGVGSYVKEEALEHLQNSFIELNKCENCWARFVCGGGCLYNHKALTKDPHLKHPQYCVKTRNLLKTAILYYKQSRG